MMLKLVSALTLLGLQTTSVNACGGFFCQPLEPVVQSGENIAFGLRQNGENITVDMTVQINYQGPAEGFAWVLPLPAHPELSTGSDLLFSGLFEATRPTFTWEVNNSRSTTCTAEQLEDFCVAFDGPESAPQAGGVARDDVAIVLETGVVGPFDFVILEAAPGDNETVFEWLNENDYDQPEEAKPLIAYYSEMGMIFVALRLTNNADSGEIRPLTLEYDIPGNIQDTLAGCVPIQLTRIAATPDMPVQIYFFVEGRAVAYNYVELGIDFALIDWLGCQFGGQNCYLNSLRSLIDAAALAVDGHAFVTEFAGPTGILEGTIAVDIDLDELRGTSDPRQFLQMLEDADVPAIPLVHTIIEKHIPNQYQDPRENNSVPPFCANLVNTYTPGFPWQMDGCIPFVDFEVMLNPVALADELEEEVFKPAREAEKWALTYPTLTRMYGQLDPDQMDKDPFFAVNAGLEDVTTEVNAVGVPKCNDEGPYALDIFIGDSAVPSGEVSATLSCGWQGNGGFVFDGTTSPALTMTGHGFPWEEAVTLFRDPLTGLFSPEQVQDLIELLDSRVPDQTVPGRIDPPEGDDTVGEDDDVAETSASTPFQRLGVIGCVSVVAMSLLFYV